jgi:hypothetical protein
MADNVNIIVQDTINDIVVNAAVVVETIDINVQAAVDTVDIVANPNNYVVNINRIIGEQVQSDWDQADDQAPDYIKNKPTIPTATSDLTNDGEDGINPFITAADVTPQVNSDWDATSGVAEILNKPTIPAAVTKTSDLVNDGENGVDPFITAADIPPVTGFVPYTGATDDVDLGAHDLTATQGTFATSGNPDTLTVNHSSGSGKALTITKGGAGEGIYVNKTSGSGNAVTIVGDLEATNLKRTGGTSSQFLKADGSVDSNTYFELPSLTSGSVLFSNGTTIAQDNANFFWDDTNNRLGIGTNAPAAKVTIQQSNQVYAPIDLVNFDMALGIAADTSLISGLDFKNFNSTGQVRLMARNNQNDYIAINTYGTSAVGTLFGINRTNIHAIFGQGAFDSTKKLAIGTFNVGDLILGTNNTERMRIFAGGNVAINTTTNAGYRLDVNGTARVNNNLSVATSSTSFSGLTVGGAASQNYVTIDSTQNAELRFHLNGGMKSILRQYSNEFRFYNTSGAILANWHVVNNNFVFSNTTIGPVADTSSVMEIRSTDRGFLPPRMTTTQKNAIAAPAAGLVVYDTDLNQLCTYDGTWGDSPFYQQSLRGVRYFTDFDSSTKFDKLVSSTGGVAASTARLTNFVPNQTANQIGIAHYQTGTSTTGWALHVTEQSANAQQFQLGGGTWMYESYIEVDTLSDATNRFRFISGFGNVANSGAETNGAFFTYDEGGVSNGTIASPNWQCVTTVGAVRTLTTTSVAVTTTWTKLRIIVNADATEVKFYIDGTLVATHTTNIPVLPNRLKVLQKLVKNLGTGNRFVYCDYLFYENNLTTLR